MLLWLLFACRPLETPVPERGSEIRYSPVPEPSGMAEELVQRVPESTWDGGLARAATLLVAHATDRRAHLSVEAVTTAQAIAGYPGQASFAKEVNGGALPESIAEDLANYALSSKHPVDIGLARRDYADGLTLWVGGVARRAILVDPMPRDLSLDQPVAVMLETSLPELLLFVAPPGAPVEVFEPTGGVALWVDRFHIPGTYTLEVVNPEEGEVLALWHHFVETRPPAMSPLVPLPKENPDPMQATERLYEALDRLRTEAGLPPVQRFENFEALAREHAALMAHQGRIAHVLPGLSGGVAAVAQRDFVPLARHHEAVAAGYFWEEAMDLVRSSPGHLRTLLCEPCTHASIGVVLEPTLDMRPRLFVVWELLEFPSGLPERKPW